MENNNNNNNNNKDNNNKDHKFHPLSDDELHEIKMAQQNYSQVIELVSGVATWSRPTTTRRSSLDQQLVNLTESFDDEFPLVNTKKRHDDLSEPPPTEKEKEKEVNNPKRKKGKTKTRKKRRQSNPENYSPLKGSFRTTAERSHDPLLAPSSSSSLSSSLKPRKTTFNVTHTSGTTTTTTGSVGSMYPPISHLHHAHHPGEARRIGNNPWLPLGDSQNTDVLAAPPPHQTEHDDAQIFSEMIMRSGVRVVNDADAVGVSFSSGTTTATTMSLSSSSVDQDHPLGQASYSMGQQGESTANLLLPKVRLQRAHLQNTGLPTLTANTPGAYGVMQGRPPQRRFSLGALTPMPQHLSFRSSSSTTTPVNPNIHNAAANLFGFAHPTTTLHDEEEDNTTTTSSQQWYQGQQQQRQQPNNSQPISNDLSPTTGRVGTWPHPHQHYRRHNQFPFGTPPQAEIWYSSSSDSTAGSIVALFRGANDDNNNNRFTSRCKKHWASVSFGLLIVILGVALGFGLSTTTRTTTDDNNNVITSNVSFSIWLNTLEQVCVNDVDTFDPTSLAALYSNWKQVRTEWLEEETHLLESSLIVTLPANSCHVENIALLSCLYDTNPSIASSNDDEQRPTCRPSRFALLVLFMETNGNALWRHHENWMDPNVHECQWFGVICKTIDKDNEQVPVSIDLSRNGLLGTLPTVVLNCLGSHLHRLDLSSNQIHGTLSTGIASLIQLEHFDMRVNDLKGTIPPEFFSSLSLLTHLDLSLNSDLDTSNTLPEFGRLSRLRHLSLAQTKLVGTIPTELGQLTRLVTLSLHRNGLTGLIPTDLLRLNRTLQELDLRENYLKPHFDVLYGLTNLQQLVLHNCAGSQTGPHGTLSSRIGQLSQLKNLGMDNCGLTGTLPTELGDCTALTTLFFRRNFLQEPLPTELIHLSRLQSLDLRSNTAIQGVPDGLCDIRTLQVVYPNFCL